MGNFLDFLKNEISLLLRNKKSLISILFLGILVLGLFLGIELLREQKILKSRAAADPIVFVPSDDVFQKDGKWFTKSNKVSLQLTSPLGPPAVSSMDAPPPTETADDKTSPTSTFNLSKSTGLAAGEEVTLTFNATDNSGGSGVKVIHTALVSGVSSEAEAKADINKWGAGYKGFRIDKGEKAEIKAKAPFYVEYFAEDIKGNKETVKNQLVPVSASTVVSDTTPPVTDLQLSKTSKYITGEEVTLIFKAADTGGSGATTIHTTLISGVNSEAEAKASGTNWNAGYQGIDLRSQTQGQRKTKVPFYVEYFAVDKQGNKETVKKLPVVSPVVNITLSPDKRLSGGYQQGEQVAVTFTASGGSGAGSIHTTGVSNVSSAEAAKANTAVWGAGYKGFSFAGGQRTFIVPFYLEYLAEDKLGNKDNHTLLVTSTGVQQSLLENIMSKITRPVYADSNIECKTEYSPSELGINDPYICDRLHKYVLVNKDGSSSTCQQNNTCTKNSECPQNTKQSKFINESSSAWCIGLKDGARCLQLQYTGKTGDNEETPCKIGEEAGSFSACSGNACNDCILNDMGLLRTYQGYGWDISCNKQSAVVNDWCSKVNPAGCNDVKTKKCTSQCSGSSSGGSGGSGSSGSGSCTVNSWIFPNNPPNKQPGGTPIRVIAVGQGGSWQNISYKVDDGTWKSPGEAAGEGSTKTEGPAGTVFSFIINAGSDGLHKVYLGQDYNNGNATLCGGNNPGTFVTEGGNQQKGTPNTWNSEKCALYGSDGLLENVCVNYGDGKDMSKWCSCAQKCTSISGQSFPKDFPQCANIDTTPPGGTTPAPDSTAPSSQIDLSPDKRSSGGYTAGEEVTVKITAVDNTGGSGVKFIHATLVSGVSSEAEAKADGAKWNSSYKGYRIDKGEKAEIKAKAPFYVEYLAEDIKGNKETLKKELVSVAGVRTGTTKFYRVAENPTDLEKAEWKEYKTEPASEEIIFKDNKPGQKSVFVEFKDSAGKTERRTAQITLIEKVDEKQLSCQLSFEGNNTILTLKGRNFGDDKGKVESGETYLQIKKWTKDSVVAVWPNAPTGETLNVTLTDSAEQSNEFQCSAVSQLALGAKVFCRQPFSHQTENVELILAGAFPGGTKVKQKVSIDKDGIIQGLTQKLEAGKNYILSLKAPKSLRRNISFTAGEGTTSLPNVLLPVGDIFPADGGDGIINVLDHDALVRQIVISKDVRGRSADFNQDNRVNSVDWACMSVSIENVLEKRNNKDDPEPVAGGETASSSASLN